MNHHTSLFGIGVMAGIKKKDTLKSWNVGMLECWNVGAEWFVDSEANVFANGIFEGMAVMSDDMNTVYVNDFLRK